MLSLSVAEVKKSHPCFPFTMSRLWGAEAVAPAGCGSGGFRVKAATDVNFLSIFVSSFYQEPLLDHIFRLSRD